MARLRRMPYSKPIPSEAEIITHKGKPHARFLDDGRTVIAPLTKKGDRIRLLSKKWYGEYRDASGILRCKPLSTDKTAAGQMLADLVKKAERKKANLTDPFESHSNRPLLDHLDDYRRYLEAEGNCKEYVDKTSARVRSILDGCRFVFIADLTSEKVAEYLHGLRRDPPRPVLPPGQESFTPREMVAAIGGIRPPRLARLLRREGLQTTGGNGRARRYPRATVESLQDRLCRGIGISTSNGYLTAMKGFSRWLVEKERTDRDRLTSLSRLNAKTDPRHERRALPEQELQVILASAHQSTAKFQGVVGKDRMMLYAVAMVTGFRASELVSLVPSSFDLDSDRPTVTVKAAYSKNRRTSIQPLPLDVAAALRLYLASKPATGPVWPGSWYKDAAEMLRLDLQAVGIPYRDGDGCVADFHALRHSYITMLERSGVSPKLAQELARHSDIRLTMNVYTHARLHDLSGAVEGLPTLLPPGSTAELSTLKATGTDGRTSSMNTSSLRTACASGDVRSERLIAIDREPARSKDVTMNRNPLEMQAVANGCESLIADEEELPGLDSNQDKENQKRSVPRSLGFRPYPVTGGGERCHAAVSLDLYRHLRQVI